MVKRKRAESARRRRGGADDADADDLADDHVDDGDASTNDDETADADAFADAAARFERALLTEHNGHCAWEDALAAQAAEAAAAIADAEAATYPDWGLADEQRYELEGGAPAPMQFVTTLALAEPVAREHRPVRRVAAVRAIHRSWAAFLAYKRGYERRTRARIAVASAVSAAKRNEQLAPADSAVPLAFHTWQRVFACHARACPFSFTAEATRLRSGQWVVMVQRGRFFHAHADGDDWDEREAQADNVRLVAAQVAEELLQLAPSDVDNELQVLAAYVAHLQRKRAALPAPLPSPTTQVTPPSTPVRSVSVAESATCSSPVTRLTEPPTHPTERDRNRTANGTASVSSRIRSRKTTRASDAYPPASMMPPHTVVPSEPTIPSPGRTKRLRLGVENRENDHTTREVTTHESQPVAEPNINTTSAPLRGGDSTAKDAVPKTTTRAAPTRRSPRKQRSSAAQDAVSEEPATTPLDPTRRSPRSSRASSSQEEPVPVISPGQSGSDTPVQPSVRTRAAKARQRDAQKSPAGSSGQTTGSPRPAKKISSVAAAWAALLGPVRNKQAEPANGARIPTMGSQTTPTKPSNQITKPKPKIQTTTELKSTSQTSTSKPKAVRLTKSNPNTTTTTTVLRVAGVRRAKGAATDPSLLQVVVPRIPSATMGLAPPRTMQSTGTGEYEGTQDQDRDDEDEDDAWEVVLVPRPAAVGTVA